MIEDVELRRGELEALCRRFGVGRLEIFGSAAAGRFQTETSDLDFMVEFAPPTDTSGCWSPWKPSSGGRWI